MKLKKKAFSISEVPVLVVTFGVIALIIGMMAVVLTQLRDTGGNTGLGSRADSNLATLTNVAVYFADYDSKGEPGVSCTNVVVSYDDNDITSAATLSGAGNCYAAVNATYNNSETEINYTFGFTTYSLTYNISGQGLEAQMTLSGWQTTWIVIVASAVVLGIISAYLFFKRE
jgi:hypothetical protein